MQLRLVLALSVLGVASSAHATISEALSLEELVRRADHVVVATAIGERARRDARGRIVTDYTVRVDEVMKGDARPGATLVMTRLGGVLGDVGMRVEGEPSLEVGARYVLFLDRLSDGRTLRPVGMSQGVLPVQDRGGEPTVLPGGGGLSLVQRVRGGRLVPAPAAILHATPLAELRDRVERIEDRRGAVRP
ncbi:MAG TPA: hypothetical protein VIL20_23275 [Sandaracinaceae bacterium]